MERTIKQPYEIASVVRKQTFYVELRYSLRKPEDQTPMKIFTQFSRFIFCVINEERKATSANIPIPELAGICHKTNYAANLNYSMEGKKKELSSGYTTRFVAGEFKGKTPAQVLSELGEKGLESLRSQYKWLTENVERYPRNKDVMDAITDAVNHYKNGSLDSSNNVDSMVLYEADLRPLRSRKRDDGKVFVYRIRILWHFGIEYPVSVEITNYYAPLEILPDGRFNVKVSERDKNSVITNVMAIKATEWLHITETMKNYISALTMNNVGLLTPESAYQASETKN